jgi:acyl carrier protein
MSLKEGLQKFIKENLVGEGQPLDITEEESLIERGIIDSMGLMQLLQFIEERTGIRIPDEEIFPANFASIATIVQTVERLRGRV